MIGSPFLKLVSEDLLRKHADSFSDMVVVFPNNRARMFFDEYIVEASDKPLWSPSYTTIKDLFQQHSSLQIADSIKLVCLLHKVYTQVTEEENKCLSPEEQLTTEDLDSFYHWGEVLLADFEDVDSNLVEVEQLFQNIKDLSAYEEDPASYLSEEQKEGLKRFFHAFDADENTRLKDRFLHLWKTLMPTYERFQKVLNESGIAYEGMLKRSVVEELRHSGTDSFKAKKYVFIGFNVLNKCESELFNRLNMAGKALFYWDVDAYYMTKNDFGRANEASIFMAENLSKFKNELEINPKQSVFSNTDRKIAIVSAATETAQAKYVETFLKEMKLAGYKDSDTAVVLCNEPLLLSVLHSIPEEVKSINITMGLPIIQTPIYGLIQLLIEYQNLLYYYIKTNKKNPATLSLSARLVLPLARNHYLQMTIPSLQELVQNVSEGKKRYFKLNELEEYDKDLFAPALESPSLVEWLSKQILRVAKLFRKENLTESSLYDGLYKEAIYRAYMIMQRLSSLVEEKSLEVDYPLMSNLIDRLLTSTSVPFTGDEQEGTQIMGFLETRNLDFSNVILLSANEGTLPNSGKETSFIPYNLRVGFGMTTVEHKNALYAYYFYRLLQRAENISFMYNVSTDGTSKGQMSRFLMQLLVESKFQIKRKNVLTDVRPMESNIIMVEKTGDILRRLKESYGNGKTSFSPSSFITFITCPLRFYMSYVLQMKKTEEMEEEVQASEFGTIFHAAMRYYYEDLLEGRNRLIQESDFPENPRKSVEADYVNRMNKCVEKAFRIDYFKIKREEDAMPELSGDQLMNRDAVVLHMRRMLSIDREYAPFQIISMEKEYEHTFSVLLNDGETLKVRLKGTIDRVDQKEGVVRILDYKTGGRRTALSTMENLFNPNTKNHYPLQVFLYAYMYASRMGNKQDIKPAIAYLNSCKNLSDLDMCLSKNEKTNPLPVKSLDNTISSVNDCFDELETLFVGHVKDLFDEKSPFMANRCDNSCRYCDFKTLCGVKG